MAARSRVLVLTGEAGTADAVRAAIEPHEHLEVAEVCSDLSDLAHSLERMPAAAAVVDIDPEPARMLASLEPIVAKFPKTRFVVLSNTLTNDLLFEAMQVGVRNFLLKKSVASELAEVLERLVPETWATGERGSIITVLSAGGGCGSTTVALNLANELGHITAKPALLADLDSSYGSVAAFLGLEGQYGIADVLAYGDRIDASLVRSSAMAYSGELHVLLSPASVKLVKQAPLQYEHLSHALEACKSAYGHTVVDAPRVSVDVAADLAAASKATLLVFQLTVKDIRLARLLLSALTERGVSGGMIVLVANRYRKRDPVPLEEAQKAMKDFSIRCVSNDFRSAVRAINYGQPLAEAAPSSVLRRDIRQIAVEVGLKETNVGAKGAL